MADASSSTNDNAKVKLTNIEYNFPLQQFLTECIGVFRDSLATALLSLRYDEAAFYAYAPPEFCIDKKRALDHKYYKYSIGLSSSEPIDRLALFLSHCLKQVTDAVVLVATTDHEGDYFLQSYGVPFVLIDRPQSTPTLGARPAYLIFNNSTADVRSIRRALKEGAVFPSLTVVSVSTRLGSQVQEDPVITVEEAQTLASNVRQVVVDIFDNESRLICDFGGEVARL